MLSDLENMDIMLGTVHYQKERKVILAIESECLKALGTLP